MAKNQKYTVVAVYLDEGETITEAVEAKDFEGACEAFWKTRDPEDTGMSIVEMFKGGHESVMPVMWVDHPNAHKDED